MATPPGGLNAAGLTGAAGPPGAADVAALGNAAAMGIAPEFMIPLEIGKQHAPAILMMPLIVFSIIFAIAGIIAFSTAKSKASGVMLLVLGLLLGGGALAVVMKTETMKKA
jgi:hypothetical protein